MKKVYEKPIMCVETFVANEYCSTCSAYMYCNAGNNKKGEIWKDSNNNGVLDEGDELITGKNPLTGKDLVFTSCSKKHTIDLNGTNEFFKGFYTEGKNDDTNMKNPIEVYVWREWISGKNDDGKFRWHTHASTEIIEANKS